MSLVFGLVARDGPNCHICGLCCDLRSSGYATRLMATRDHLRPLSKGGKPGPVNQKLAHAYCNSKRGNRDHITENFRTYCRTWIAQYVGMPAVAEAESWFERRIKGLMPTSQVRQ